MKRLYTLLLATLLIPTLTMAADDGKEPLLDIYGFVRADLFYNSRASVAAFNEIFYLYPMDIELDALGNDLNEGSNSGMFAFISRAGLDLKGQKIGSATVTAKIEVDFGGYSSYNMLLRLRHAYFNLAWDKGHSIILGQTWHPLFGTVMPYMNNVSTGAPYQPFARSPQVRYTYKTGKFELLAAALCQLQYNSAGPNGYSNEYAIDSSIPEIYIGGDFRTGNIQIGGGVNILTLTPRTQSEVNGLTYNVDESMTAISGEAHFRYTKNLLNIGVKSVFASAMEHMALLGGYGVTGISGVNETYSYTPLHNSTSWINITYGKKWRPSLFVGYTKNLGSTKPLESTSLVYGRGVDIDQLLGANLGINYNISSLSFGLEYSATTAWYGDLNLSNGRVSNTHAVTGNRVVGTATYLF